MERYRMEGTSLPNCLELKKNLSFFVLAFKKYSIDRFTPEISQLRLPTLFGARKLSSKSTHNRTRWPWISTGRLSRTTLGIVWTCFTGRYPTTRRGRSFPWTWHDFSFNILIERIELWRKAKKDQLPRPVH